MVRIELEAARAPVFGRFASSRRSILAAGLGLGVTLALHSAARAETKDAMLAIKETDIATNGVHLHVTEAGEGPATH